MDQILHKNSLFSRPEISDFVIIIGDQRLNVHKSVLMSSSEYFSALFNSAMIETKNKEITLKETLIKPFLIVLKLSYGIAMTDEEWLELKIQEFCESIVTANKYQFIGCEQQLSQKLIDIFEYKLTTSGDQTTDNTTIWEVLEMAKLHNLMILFELCLNFFDENINYAFETFDYQFISADILLDVIRRDTFGAQEIRIFQMVEKWIQKHKIVSNRKCIEEEMLLECVRLNLLSLQDLTTTVNDSGLYDQEVIERTVKHEFNSVMATNKRICYESGKLFRATDCKNELHLKSDQMVVICVNCLLPMPSKINHIMFYIQPIDRFVRFVANYWIGIADSQAENGFRKILDYTHDCCFGDQDLYFETPFVADSIRIVFECIIEAPTPPIDVEDIAPVPPSQQQGGARPREPGWRRRSLFVRRIQEFGPNQSSKVMSIGAIEYEYTKSPLKTINSFIVPEVNVCQKRGVQCSSPYFGNRFTAYLNEEVLNNSCERGKLLEPSDDPLYRFYDNWEFEQTYSRSSYDVIERSTSSKKAKEPFDNHFKNLIQRPISLTDQTNHYIIRLSQPIVVDCLQFELILENEKRRHSEECLAAECKVELSSSFNRDMSSAEWTVVSNDSYLTQSGYCNLEFELQKVSVIRISGFRYNSDKSLIYSLHLKNLTIPADRHSLPWSYGAKLGNEPTAEVGTQSV